MRLENLQARLVRIAIRLIQGFRIGWYRQLSTAKVSARPILYQPVQFVGLGTIHCEREVRIGVYPSPFFLSGYGYIEARNPQARVTIGEGTWINNNFVAIAEYKSITIGRRVLIGTAVEIIDSDFHGLALERRMTPNPDNSRDILIEDDVFIGSNVKVLKGVHIGPGSVIANGAIVTRDIPSGVVAGGIPARIIRYL